MSKEKKIIVTGIHGFVGGHLARHLQSQGYAVHGIGRETSANETIEPLIDAYSQADLLDAGSLQTVPMRGALAIIHLAGLASVADSFTYPDAYKADNRTMTDNLLNAAHEQGFTGRTVVISTGALYDATQPMPLSEASATAELSPYSIGKLAAEATAIEHRDAGMDVVIVRPFNHIGPGQSGGFLLSDLYAQISAGASGGKAKVSVGNLASKRDYTDVRDIVKAYELLAVADRLDHEIYNVSSGNSYSGQQILDTLAREMDVEVQAVVDASKIRPTDPAEIIGDSSRIKNELGWSPSIPLSQTIADFVSSKN